MFNNALSIISLFNIAMGSIVLFNMTLGNCLMDDIVHVSIKLFSILYMVIMHYIIFLSYFELGNILFPTIEFGCILPIIITLVNVLLFYIVLSKISPSNIPLRYIELFNNGQYCIR